MFVLGKYYTRLERLARDKHSSLSEKSVNYGCKKGFYTIGYSVTDSLCIALRIRKLVCSSLASIFSLVNCLRLTPGPIVIEHFTAVIYKFS